MYSVWISEFLLLNVPVSTAYAHVRWVFSSAWTLVLYYNTFLMETAKRNKDAATGSRGLVLVSCLCI